MRFGVVGTGAAGRENLEVLKLIGAEAASWSPDQEPVIPYKEFLRTKMDTVIVATPPPTHASLAFLALERGLHVLIEKPLATCWADADMLIEAAEKNGGLTLSVIAQRRWIGGAQTVKEEACSGIQLGDAECSDWKDPASFARSDWRRTWGGAGGGVLMNQMPHHIDLLCWLMGEPVEVYGCGANLGHQQQMSMEDTVAAIITFASGANATLRGSISSRAPLGNKVKVQRCDGFQQQISWGIDSHNDIELRAAQIRDFVEAVEEGRPPAVTAAEARTVVSVIEGIYESMGQGRPIEL